LQIEYDILNKIGSTNCDNYLKFLCFIRENKKCEDLNKKVIRSQLIEKDKIVFWTCLNG